MADTDDIPVPGVDLHASDCAIYSEPAYPAGPCDCGYEEQGD